MQISSTVIHRLFPTASQPRPVRRWLAVIIPVLLAGGLALVSALAAALTARPAAAAPQANVVGLNGAACAFATVGEAIAAATGGDTIYLSAGTYNETLGTLNNDLSFIAATADCTAAEPDPNPTHYTIDGGGAYSPQGGLVAIGAGHHVTFTAMRLRNGTADDGGIVYVAPNAAATFHSMYLEDGMANSDGGVIYVADQGSLYLGWLSRVFGGMAVGEGGGLYIAGTAEIIQAVAVADNQAAKGGGIALAGSGYLLLQSTDVGTGAAPNNALVGGGIYLSGQAHLRMSGNSRIIFNTATAGNGGGVYATGDVLVEMTGGRVYGNEAPGGFGGGLYADNGARIELSGYNRFGHENPTWGPNSAVRGGGLYLDGAEALVIQDSATIDHNEAGDFGGGIYLTGATPMTMTGGIILSNTAGVSGGGLANQNGRIDLQQGAVIAGNEALLGGGLYQANNSDNWFMAVDSQIISNTATADGGGLYVLGGDVILQDRGGQSKLSGNTAGGNGGGAFGNHALVLWLRAAEPGSRLRVEDNTAGLNGGGIYAENDTDVFLVDNVLVAGNTALNNGGGLHQTGGRLITAAIPQGGQASTRPEISGNHALNGHGGGLYLIDVSSSPGNPGSIIAGAGVTGNTADGSGGGLYVASNSYVRLFSSQVNDNQANQGAGLMLSSARVEVDHGAAIPGLGGCHNALLPADTYCSEFRGNGTTGGSGGAIRMQLLSTLIMSNTAVIGNSAFAGSALYSATNGDEVDITNSLIAGNNGKALYAAANVNLEIIQSTLADNDWAIDVNTGGAVVEISNSIIWGNGFGVESAVAIAGGCSISQNGVGGLAVDPLFHTTGRGDFRLAAGSPAIDACAIGSDIDLDEIPRPAGPAFDMGAFEAGRPLVMLSPLTEVVEGDGGLTPAGIVISLSEAGTTPVTVDVTAVSGTAESGIDFEALDTTLTFNPGTTSQIVPLNIIGDLVYEADENLTLHLSAAGAVLPVTSTQVLIVNDDSLPVLLLSPGSVVEGDAGLTAMMFAVELSNPSAFTATVAFNTYENEGSGPSAEEGIDYQDNSGLLTFAPGQTAAEVRVWVIGDLLEEDDEIFWLDFDNGVGLVHGPEGEQVTGTILDDDGETTGWQVYLPLLSR
jgi:predicted outer membrane repeat protein